MGYSCALVNAYSSQVCMVPERHHFRGSTYVLGGTDRLDIGVTSNYQPFFHEAFGEFCRGLWTIDGMTAKESIGILSEVILRMNGEPDEDYYAKTEGNAKKALEDLRELAKLAPGDAIWAISH